jgi:hypothetical protein
MVVTISGRGYEHTEIHKVLKLREFPSSTELPSSTEEDAPPMWLVATMREMSEFKKVLKLRVDKLLRAMRVQKLTVSR